MYISVSTGAHRYSGADSQPSAFPSRVLPYRSFCFFLLLPTLLSSFYCFYFVLSWCPAIKCALSNAEDLIIRSKRTKLATGAPSTTGTQAACQAIQTNSLEKIMDDRPLPDVDIPPIPRFGHFLDIMDDLDNFPGVTDIHIPQLRAAVDDLASKMTGFFDTEQMRRDTAVSCLMRIFSARGSTLIPPIKLGPIGTASSDGYNCPSHGGWLLFVDIKDEATGIDSHAQIELLGRVACLNATRMDEDKVFRKLFGQLRIPSLGLTIVGALDISVVVPIILISLGCDITFYVIVPLDTHHRLVLLTPTLSCIESASDGCDCLSLYSAFIAALVLQAHFQEDAERIKETPHLMPISVHARRFPAVSRLRKYPPPSDQYLTFKIQGHFYDEQPYIAKTAGSDKPVLIKFVRRYSTELH